MSPPSEPSPTGLPVLGWREWIALPDLGVPAIKAKLDTGARTSAVHAFDVTQVDRHGQRFVRFQIHPVQRRDEPSVDVEAPLLGTREVRSSNGEVEQRLVITTTFAICGRTERIELTLARRDEMGFRMLLGREALRGRFLVDPGSSYLSGLDDAARAARRATPRRDRP